MMLAQYAVLAVHTDGTVTTHGPCRSRLDADSLGWTIGMTTPDVVATKSIALTTPRDTVVTTLADARSDQVIQAPDEIAALISARNQTVLGQSLPDQSIPDQTMLGQTVLDTSGGAVSDPHHRPDAGRPISGSAVVWVLIHGQRRVLGVLIGPFPGLSAADAWVAASERSVPPARSQEPAIEVSAPGSTGQRRHLADVEVLALQTPQSPQPDSSDESSLPAVVALETEDGGWVVLGPFPDSLHATAYWHQISSVLTIENTRAVHILPVEHPDHTDQSDYTDQSDQFDEFDRPAPGSAGARSQSAQQSAGPSTGDLSGSELRAHVVLTIQGNEISATGWFTDEPAARAWHQARESSPATSDTRTYIVAPVLAF